MKNIGLKKHGDKLLFILALAVLAGVLIRFAVRKPSAHTAEKVIPAIVFTQWWEDYFEEGFIPELIKEFKDTHDGIDVVLNYMSYEDLHRELFYARKNSAPPGDIITVDSLWVPELIKNKTMEFSLPESSREQNPETPYVSKASYLSFINVFYYNIDILKEAGFSHPPKNRSEFLNYAKTVTGKEKSRWAITMGGNSSRGIYDDILPWIWAAGAELIKDGKPALNSRSVNESLSFIASLESGGFIVPGSSSAGAEKKLEDFVSGRAAFMIAPVTHIEYVRKRMGEEAFSITSIPTPDNYAGKTYHASVGWTLGIHEGTANKEEARLFADFIAGKADALSEKLIQGNNTRDLLYAKVWDIAIANENAADFNGLPWEKLNIIFDRELSNLLAGKASPAETAGAIQKKWEEALP